MFKTILVVGLVLAGALGLVGTVSPIELFTPAVAGNSSCGSCG
jgi:hypothetical protein